MDVIFIIPSPDRPTLQTGGLCPPLGVGSMCTVLAEHGIESKIIDMYADEYSRTRLKSEIEKEKPKIVGLSMFSESFSKGCEIARLCKEVDNSICVVIGGIDATFRAEEYLQKCNSINIAVLYEGEKAILEIYENHIHKRKQLNDINGIMYRENESIYRNAKRPPQNLDELPYIDRKFFDLSKYKYPYTVVTSKGCPYACLFCGGGAVGRGYQERSLKSIEEELEHISKIIKERGEYEDHHLIFWDDAFSIFPDRVIAIGRIAKKYDLKWGCQCRINEVSLEQLRLMKELNCQKLNFGVESGDKEILADIQKGIDLEEVIKIARFCSNIKLAASFNFIAPFPTDTEASLANTLSFAEQLNKLDYISISFNVNTPFPGTYMYNESKGMGIKFVTDNDVDYNFKNPVFETQYLNMNSIKKHIIKALILESKSKEDKKRLGIKY
jgi:radical SAM superfamily enzyme YgiQ (UPF0313 family)